MPITISRSTFRIAAIERSFDQDTRGQPEVRREVMGRGNYRSEVASCFPAAATHYDKIVWFLTEVGQPRPADSQAQQGLWQSGVNSFLF